MDSNPIINQPALWAFIRTTVWISIVVYAGVLVLAAAIEVVRLQWTKMVPLNRRRYFTFVTKRGTRLFLYLELLRFYSNCVICVVYVYSTYVRQVSARIAWVNRIFGAFFVADFFVNFAGASNAVLYTFTFARFLQIFSLPSLFRASGPHAFLHFGFLRAFSAYDSFIKVEQRILGLFNTPQRFGWRLVAQLLALFYVLAAGIQLLEIPGDLLDESVVKTWTDHFGRWHFFNCVYFVIVTLSTVGYGDFSPVSIQGRVYTIFLIIIGVIMFTNVITAVIAELRRQRGDGTYDDRLETRHVILSGTPTLDDLVHFVTEFYTDARESNLDCDIVVLIESAKWTDAEWHKRVATNNFLTNHITYLVGSLKNTNDLNRAGIATADAIFILTSSAVRGDASMQDSQTVMSALAVRTVRTDVPIYSQIILQESHIQIRVAMSSATSPVYNPNLIFRNRLEHGAMYAGIYDDTLRLEADSLAPAFRSPEKASNEELDDVVDTSRAYQRDLDRSSFVCLQQSSSAQLVANIKANGVSTLITNMYLDIPENAYGSDQGIGQQPWLKEYLLGASCSLIHAVIPDSLDNVRIDSVAPLFLRRGIVIMATQKRRELQLNTVLSTSNELRAGELGLFLSYLTVRYLATALHLAGLDYKNGKNRILSRNFKAKFEKLEPTDRTRPVRSSDMQSALNPRLRDPSAVHQSRSFDLSAILPARLDSFDGIPAAFPPAFQASPSGLFRSRSHWDIPKDIGNHVIVCMEGAAAIKNLPFFLRMLWRREGQTAEMNWSHRAVVCIHPDGSQGLSDLFREFERHALYFVKGSPAASNSWRHARLGTANSVATFADYTNDWDVADGRTVYTLLTLDSETCTDQNLFICSEIVDERSLDFLREPLHARRRGARLGVPIMRRVGSHTPISTRSVLSDSDLETHEQNGGEITPTMLRGIAANNSVMSDPFESPDSDEFDESGTETEGARMVKEDECATDAMFGSTKVDVDATKRPGASRARRRELFARFRYSSGELLVHSTADTLLVREYAEPGFVQFISGLIGAGQCRGLPGSLSGAIEAAESSAQKIRLVRIPKSLFREFHAVNGQRLLEYGVIFERLIALGVTPLGLYRSGEAPVHLPRKRRSKRGAEMYEEATRLPVPAAHSCPKFQMLNPFRAIVETGQNVVQTGHNVMPGSVLARRGQKELWGEGVRSPTNAPKSRRLQDVKLESGSAAEGKSREGVGDLMNGGGPDGREESPPMMARLPSRRIEAADFQAIGVDDKNMLPYVYTMPEVNTLVAESDAVYVLCDATFVLPRNWPRRVAGEGETVK